MAKTFSEMTDIERRINRRRLAQGLAADFTERTDEMAIAYDDYGIRRAVRLAADEVRGDLLAREKALRDVERVLPQMNFEDEKTAAGVYKKALQQLGDLDPADFKDLDLPSLVAVFKLVTEKRAAGGAMDSMPRLRRAAAEAASEAIAQRYGVARPKRLL